ncbi:hypothetical protein EDD86DRAFT_57338 [Gorgonomyces haynaldii]|nr:hypothetical protein EDD86DRAFT_57338 [Gorgonomyces haynaldii]
MYVPDSPESISDKPLSPVLSCVQPIDKKMMRIIKNREAAQNSRKRKKEQLESFQQRALTAEAQVEKLRQQVERLSALNAGLVEENKMLKSKLNIQEPLPTLDVNGIESMFNGQLPEFGALFSVFDLTAGLCVFIGFVPGSIVFKAIGFSRHSTVAFSTTSGARSLRNTSRYFTGQESVYQDTGQSSSHQSTQRHHVCAVALFYWKAARCKTGLHSTRWTTSLDDGARHSSDSIPKERLSRPLSVPACLCTILKITN